MLAPHAVPDGWRHVLDALGAGGEPVVLAHADDPRLRRMAVLDVVLNNADRKGGHVLPGPDGVVRGVDHGVCLHREPKLRTVLWGWAGEGLTDVERELLRALCGRLDGRAGRRAVRAASRRPRYGPAAPGRRGSSTPATCRTPSEGWPAIPWPPF